MQQRPIGLDVEATRAVGIREREGLEPLPLLGDVLLGLELFLLEVLEHLPAAPRLVGLGVALGPRLVLPELQLPPDDLLLDGLELVRVPGPRDHAREVALAGLHALGGLLELTGRVLPGVDEPVEPHPRLHELRERAGPHLREPPDLALLGPARARELVLVGAHDFEPDRLLGTVARLLFPTGELDVEVARRLAAHATAGDEGPVRELQLDRRFRLTVADELVEVLGAEPLPAVERPLDGLEERRLAGPVGPPGVVLAARHQPVDARAQRDLVLAPVAQPIQ